MSSTRYFVLSALLLTLGLRSAAADGNFCSKVADDWSKMKTQIESLRDNSAAVEQLKTDLRSLTAEVNNLKEKRKFALRSAKMITFA